MPSNSPKTLAQLLKSGALERLAAGARERRELTARVGAVLPPEEAAHLVLADLDADGRLTLTMDSAAWAARVRYRTQQFGERKVRVKVLPVQSGSPGAS